MRGLGFFSDQIAVVGVYYRRKDPLGNDKSEDVVVWKVAGLHRCTD